MALGAVAPDIMLASGPPPKSRRRPDTNGHVGRMIQYAPRFPTTKDRFKLWLRSDPSFKEYLTERKHLATKQVPDALAVKGMGTPHAVRKAPELLGKGFTFSKRSEDGEKVLYYSTSDDQSMTVERSNEIIDVILEEEEFTKIMMTNARRDGARVGIEYDDPFLVIQGRVAASFMGYKPPETMVWPGDMVRLTDPIPTKFLGDSYTGKRSNKILWKDIVDPELKIEFLLKYTHWGVYLKKASEDIHNPAKLWYRSVRKKIEYFLKGKTHPGWTAEEKSNYLEKGENPNQAARALRMIQCLNHVNGMFAQRFLAFPEEEWTWEKFDVYVLRNLTIFLDDEFFDGQVTFKALGHVTRFAELKKVRKTFKMHAHRQNFAYFTSPEADQETPEWLRHLLPLYAKVGECQDEIVMASKIATLSQTRGMGTPPPLVVHQSKLKFLQTVTREPVIFNDTQLKLIRTAIRDTINEVPDYVFTGLATKARITMTSSACYEEMRKDGGTLQAVADLVSDAQYGIKAAVIDLETGMKVAEKSLKEFGAPGEYVFWRCLEYVLQCDPAILRKAMVTIVKEPAKARTVTKASAYLKIVLDVINKIISYPLTKVETSKSGMSKDAHGWNFFQSFYEEGKKEIAFDLFKRKVKEYGAAELVKDEYRALFVECTDYSNATDALQHQLAEELAVPWMTRCGIPAVLQMIVRETCFRPRPILFTARGAFKDIGVKLENDTNYVMLKTGVLMGDPTTKPVLHLLNIAVRKIAWGISTDYSSRLFPDEEGYTFPVTAIEEQVLSMPKKKQTVAKKATDVTPTAAIEMMQRAPEKTYPALRKVLPQAETLVTSRGIAKRDFERTLLFHPYTHRLYLNKNGVLAYELIPAHLRNPELKDQHMQFWITGKNGRPVLIGSWKHSSPE